MHILHALGVPNSVAWVMERLKSIRRAGSKAPATVLVAAYAAFSVGRSELERVKRYIYGQREHHREHSFEQELRDLCGREPADAAALEEFLSQEPRRGGTH